MGAAVTDGENPLAGGPALGAFFLAEARTIQDVESNLIASADEVSLSNEETSAELAMAEDGVWTTDLTLEGELVGWDPGTELELFMERDGRTFTAWVETPEPPALSGIPRWVSYDDLPDDWETLTAEDLEELATASLQDLHPPGEGLTVQVDPPAEYTVAVVADASGNITWTNVPEAAGDLVRWVLTADPVESLDIPGEAFPDPNGIYGLGVTQVSFAPTANYSGFNWLVSNLGAGTLTVAPVLTGEAR